jgi:hypothetical protein
MTAIAPPNVDNVRCPKCQGPTWNEVGGRFWGNGLTSNGKAKPTHKCKDKACGGAVWQKDADPPAPRQAPATSAKQPVSIGTTGVASIDNGYVGNDPIRAELEAGEGWVDLRAKYMESLAFVLKHVVPEMTKADIGASPESVSAMTAQIFIARRDAGV